MEFRIVHRPGFCGIYYVVESRRWWFPIWLAQSNTISTHLDMALRYLEVLKNPVVTSED